jgi:hypothetical protein
MPISGYARMPGSDLDNEVGGWMAGKYCYECDPPAAISGHRYHSGGSLYNHGDATSPSPAIARSRYLNFWSIIIDKQLVGLVPLPIPEWVCSSSFLG